jgi:hypothetical protein
MDGEVRLGLLKRAGGFPVVGAAGGEVRVDDGEQDGTVMKSISRQAGCLAWPLDSLDGDGLQAPRTISKVEDELHVGNGADTGMLMTASRPHCSWARKAAG